MILRDLTIEEQREANGGFFPYLVILAFYVGYKDAAK